MSPGELTLESHRLPLALPRSFPQAQKSSRFRWTHSPPICCSPATQKFSLPVQNLWTFRLPCGTTRKT